MKTVTSAAAEAGRSQPRWCRGRRVVPAIAAVGLVAAALAGCGSSGKPGASSTQGVTYVSIGADYSHTGSYAQYDLPGYQATQMAVDAINKTGFKVNGKTYKFKLHSIDAKSDIATAVTGARSLISDDHVVAIFGPVVSPLAVPVSTVTNSAKVILFTPSSSLGAKLGSDPASYPLTIITEPPVAGPSGAQTLNAEATAKKLDIKTVAQLWSDDATGHANAPGIQQGFTTAGAKMVYSQYYPTGTTDFQPYIQAIARLHPDAMVVGFTDADMVPMITLGRQLNAAKYYIGVGSDTPALKSGSTPLTNYIWFNNVLSQYNPTAAISKFIDQFKSATGQSPGASFGYALNMYPWPSALAQAMGAANSVSDANAIMAKMRGQTLKFPGQPTPEIPVGRDGQAYPSVQNCNLLKGADQVTCDNIEVPPPSNS